MRRLETCLLSAIQQSLRGLAKYFALFLLFTTFVQVAAAQQPAALPLPPAQESSVISTSDANNSATQADESYRIGVGDLLDIRVFNKPALSREAVRVDNRGKISMPLLESEIQAACRTEQELAKEIENLYLDYVKHPQVDVFVKEYHSQPVAVIGAVNQPGRFQLQRQVRLLELLAYAGGPKIELAGRNVHVVHTTVSSACEASPSSEAQDGSNFVAYNLAEVLRGSSGSNPFVQPGDIITLPEAEQVYVVGNVYKPSTIPLKEPLTVSRAIAMAGGAMHDTKNNRVRIIRQTPGMTTKTEIYVDLKAIEKRQAEDVALQANDIVDVPVSGGKSFLRALVGTIAPSLSQLPVRVIP